MFQGPREKYQKGQTLPWNPSGFQNSNDFLLENLLTYFSVKTAELISLHLTIR